MSDVPAALVGQDMGALHEVPNQIECFRPVSRWADALRERRGDPRGGPGRLPPLPDRPARAGRAVDPDRPPQRAGGGAAHAGWRRPAAAVRRRLVEEAARLPRAGPAPAPRRWRRRDRGRARRGSSGPSPPAPRAGDHVRDGAGRDPRDRSALARRPAQPARHAGALEAADVVLSVGCRFPTARPRACSSISSSGRTRR